MNEVFDLTTRAGIQAASGIASLAGKAAANIELDGKTVALGVGILGVLAAGIYIVSKFSDSPSPEQQSKVAGDLVERMKAQGAKSVKVKVNHDAVADMKSKVQGTFDVKGTKNGNVEVEVTFAFEQ